MPSKQIVLETFKIQEIGNVICDIDGQEVFLTIDKFRSVTLITRFAFYKQPKTIEHTHGQHNHPIIANNFYNWVATQSVNGVQRTDFILPATVGSGDPTITLQQPSSIGIVINNIHKVSTNKGYDEIDITNYVKQGTNKLLVVSSVPTQVYLAYRIK